MLAGKSVQDAKRYGLDVYTRRLLRHHVSGRLKLAPEHTEERVLRAMRKPSFKYFERFYSQFRKVCREEGLPWQMVPYFISGHPGSHERDMQALAGVLKKLGLKAEQVQEFTPTPMTLATTMYYTGIDPYTGKQVFTASTDRQKIQQKAYFFRNG